MYSEEDLMHLIRVHLKDARDANAKAEKYRRKFELCREECKKWKTRYLEAKELLDIFTIENEDNKTEEVYGCTMTAGQLPLYDCIMREGNICTDIDPKCTCGYRVKLPE